MSVRWTVFIIFTYLFLGLQVGLMPLLEYRGVTPSLLLILGVYVGLFAPPITVGWSMLMLGLLTDLTVWYEGADQSVVWLIGPASLGFLGGAFAVLQLRSLVFRDSPLAVVLLVFFVGIFVHLVTVALLTARGLPVPLGEPMAAWSAADELYHRFRQLLYSTLLAFPLAMLLLRSESLWAFQPGKRTHRM